MIPKFSILNFRKLAFLANSLVYLILLFIVIQDTDAAKNNDDVFDPSLQIEDYAKLKKPSSPPSDEWLLSCASTLASDPEILQPFPSIVRHYRLGDCVKLCDACEYKWDKNKTTIASMYGEAACRCNTAKNLRCNFDSNDVMNLTKLEEIFKVVGTRDGFVKPDPNAVVMHLRLGDVVENQKKDVGELLIEGGTGFHPTNMKTGTRDIRSVQDVLAILDEADELMMARRNNNNQKSSNINKKKYIIDELMTNNLNNDDDIKSKIIIVGGSHVPQAFEKSRVYANCLARGLAKAGRQVELYLDGADADKDFYFMSHANMYVESTGGFSLLMGMLAKHGGAIKTWNFAAEYEAFNEAYTEKHGKAKVGRGDPSFSWAAELAELEP